MRAATEQFVQLGRAAWTPTMFNVWDAYGEYVASGFLLSMSLHSSHFSYHVGSIIIALTPAISYINPMFT